MNTLTKVEPENPEPLAVVPMPQQSASLFRTDDPAEVITRATVIATALREVMTKQGLISNIQGKQYPKCEAWTLCGTMLGVFPVLVWSRPVENGWEARVEARTRDGAIVGAAEAQCLRTERNWGNRDDFAIRSMSQTRATAKALRMPLGFIMTLSGFSPTPAEEMTDDQPTTSRPIFTKPKTDPVKKGKKVATPEQLDRLVASLTPVRDAAIRYFQSIGQLKDKQTIANLSLEHCPTTKKQFDELMGEIQKFTDNETETELAAQIDAEERCNETH